ncbi:MAG: leucyl/phenylalanyl-tRNA--protein transferase [Gammaproteobacteria bacterium]|nr:leucyl/phenylalanyl-tRNA--protein transferase [Gammaproteobacteria bacterium]
MSEADLKNRAVSLTATLDQLVDEEFWRSFTAIELDVPVTVDFYLHALRRGLFPWNDIGAPRMWWSPDPRAVLYLEDFHISRSLAKCIRKDKFTVTFDMDFDSTVKGCADRSQTWLDPELIQALQELHELGFAHSAEAWLDGRLVGGVYGMDIDGVFIGDSMFYNESNASKVALAHLIEHLKTCGFQVMDCQVLNEHTESLGARNIPRSDFLSLMDEIRDSGTMPNWHQVS